MDKINARAVIPLVAVAIKSHHKIVQDAREICLSSIANVLLNAHMDIV